MYLIDSHCHLNFPELSAELGKKIENAKQADVKYMQTICTKISEFSKIEQIANKYQNIFCSVGVHPNNVQEEAKYKAVDIINLSKGAKVIGIGETGLDYYYENSARIEQKASFIEHIKAAQNTQLPVIIHSRNAEADTIAILKNTLKEISYPALIHCFTASENFAKSVLKLGLYISISGIVTFNKAEELRQIVKKIPLERLLIETDSPYLAPVPKRGKANEPAFIKHIAEYIAKLHNISYEKLAEITSQNFFSLFKKAHDYVKST
ncbi:MAG: TatD family hydrolase [Rickettsiales bacterium]